MHGIGFRGVGQGKTFLPVAIHHTGIPTDANRNAVAQNLLRMRSDVAITGGGLEADQDTTSIHARVVLEKASRMLEPYGGTMIRSKRVHMASAPYSGCAGRLRVRCDLGCSVPHIP